MKYIFFILAISFALLSLQITMECFMPSLQRSLKETVSQKEQLPSIVDDAIRDIARRTEFLHAMIDELSSSFQQQVLDMQKTELERLITHEKQLRDLIEYLASKELSQNCTLTDTEEPSMGLENVGKIMAINLGEEDVTRIQKLSEFEHICLHFKGGSASKRDMLSMFGSVENYHITLPSSITKYPPINSPKFAVKLVAKFKCDEPSTNIHAILPISDSEAWLCCGWGSKNVHLYNSSGAKNVSLDLDIRVDDMCMTSSGDILISSYNGMIIKRVDENLQVSTFTELNFIVRGMTVTGVDEIYVCGIEKVCASMDDSSHRVQKDPRHVIAKLSNIGEILNIINVSPHDPHRIAVHTDGSIAFSDCAANNKRQLVVVDSEGEVKVTYKGPFHIELDNPFYPLGVCQDRYEHILISDWNNDTIHLLNKEGHFIRFLLSDDHGLECPNALAIDREDQLWIGDGMGGVRIFQYVH